MVVVRVNNHFTPPAPVGLTVVELTPRLAVTHQPGPTTPLPFLRPCVTAGTACPIGGDSVRCDADWYADWRAEMKHSRLSGMMEQTDID